MDNESWLLIGTSAGMFNAMSVQPLVAAERVVFYRGMQRRRLRWARAVKTATH